MLTIGFVNKPLHGHVLQLTPDMHDQAIHWTCAGDVPTKLLPSFCRSQQ